jgi:hypothetical protein
MHEHLSNQAQMRPSNQAQMRPGKQRKRLGNQKSAQALGMDVPNHRRDFG